ncbi:hypothetical protein BGX31_003687 [Mortierella sp. GBA43]|nr:hypothetical protein BGX31_003687 [Mortierella sp. GBA43]
MKSNGKDKMTPASAPEPQDEQVEGKLTIKSDTTAGSSIHDKEADKEQTPNINGKDGSINAPESPPSAINTAAEGAENDMELKQASPTSDEVNEQDTPMTEVPPRRSNSGSGVSEAINQEDLDGGLLDGALDDDDDLDQDTEDTEVGNVDDFSEDDDDLDDLDDRLLDSSDKPCPDDMHSPGELSHADTSKYDDQDSEQEDNGDQRKGPAPAHSDDSDSDLPEPDGSDNENDEDEDGDDEDNNGNDSGDGDDEEDDADDDDAADGDMDVDDERPTKKISEPRKESTMSQKPILNRPSTTTEEELKDSGDDLSDLSDFDDTDDSDEDDNVPTSKSTVKESNTTNSATVAVGNGKPQAGRKRSLQNAAKDSSKLDQESVKPEQKSLAEIANGKARLSERKISQTEDIHHSDKESESEEHQEEDEEQEKPVEEEEEEEDLETKQLHKDALQALTDIEVEFASLRDKMYEERMAELDREVDMINAGTHPELSSLMQEIEQKREQRLRFADMSKRYTIDIAQTTYQVAEYRAHCTFQSARRTARTDLVQTLGKKRQKLLMELRLSSDTHKRQAIDDKATLMRSRKVKRIEANDLRTINERSGFPASKKPTSATDTELDRDFESMGVRASYEISRSSTYKDAVNGTYSAKYMYHTNDEIILQKNDGSKTRAPLGYFRTHRLYMKPKP